MTTCTKCPRPAWGRFQRCRRCVLYQRQWRARNKSANLLARVRLANQRSATQRRDRNKPGRRRYRCGVAGCRQAGHNAQTCPKTLRGLTMRLALALGT